MVANQPVQDKKEEGTPRFLSQDHGTVRTRQEAKEVAQGRLVSTDRRADHILEEIKMMEARRQELQLLYEMTARK